MSIAGIRFSFQGPRGLFWGPPSREALSSRFGFRVNYFFSFSSTFASFGFRFLLFAYLSLSPFRLLASRRLAFRPEGEAETTLAPPPCQKLFTRGAFFLSYPQVTQFLSPVRGSPAYRQVGCSDGGQRMGRRHLMGIAPRLVRERRTYMDPVSGECKGSKLTIVGLFMWHRDTPGGHTSPSRYHLPRGSRTRVSS
jgi:hypothetical protein